MNKNLQNGFILGAALQGKTEAVEPQGEIEITENGTYDVSAYATADVEVNPYPVNVTFMNGENEYAKMGVSSSDVSINAPTTNPPIPIGKNVFKGWAVDGSTTIEAFPKSYTQDTILNALFVQKYADDLYAHYGISKKDYPYMFFKGANNNTCRLIFCNWYTNENGYIRDPYRHYYNDKFNSKTVNWNSLYDTYQWIINNMTDLSSTDSVFYEGGSGYMFGNVPSENIVVNVPYQEL